MNSEIIQVPAAEPYEVVLPGASAADFEALVARSLGFLRELNDKQPERIASWFADGGEMWIPPSKPRMGPKRIARLLRVIFEQYERLAWRATRLYPVNATTMITEVESWGTFMDGRSYQNSILTVQRFDRDGKILLLSDYFKATDVFSPPVK